MGKNKQKPRGYWMDINNVINEIEQIQKEYFFKTLPSSTILSKFGHSSLVHAIKKYYGGFQEFRKKVLEENIKPRGYWKNINNVIKELNRIKKKHDFKILPSAQILSEIGYSRLLNAINRYHKYPNVKKILGEKYLRVKCGQWKDLEFTVYEAKKVMKKYNFKILPPFKKLTKLGYSSLAISIIKYHRGFREFRKQIGEEQIIRRNGVWKDLDYTIKEAKKVMKNFNIKIFPTQEFLNKNGYNGLSAGITRYHGGFPYFRSILNKELGIESEKERLENVIQGYVNE